MRRDGMLAIDKVGRKGGGFSSGSLEEVKMTERTQFRVKPGESGVAVKSTKRTQFRAAGAENADDETNSLPDAGAEKRR